jgi:hypothetical protein
LWFIETLLPGRLQAPRLLGAVEYFEEQLTSLGHRFWDAAGVFAARAVNL